MSKNMPLNHHKAHVLPFKGKSMAFLTGLCTEIFKKKGAFVLFKRPFSEDIEGFFAKPEGWARSHYLGLHKVSKAFLIHPFARQNGCYLLKPTLSISLSKNNLSYTCVRGQEKYWKSLFLSPAHPVWQTPSEIYGAPVRVPPLSQTQYTALIEKALAAISQKEVQKVVLSRYKKLIYKASFSPIRTFMRVAERYPEAFSYVLCAPGLGLWMGASPECLASCQGSTFQSVALAGTQALPPSGSLHGVTWSQKEQQEHTFVKDYIFTQLQEAGLPNIQAHPTETIRAAHMLHLRTLFTGTLAGPEGLLSKVLQRLHPTPALCGYPTSAAEAFIAAHEPTSRALYGGFLGPIYGPKHYQLHVNIRCARLYQDHALLYVGAGIVAGSNPEQEWLETETKGLTMQKLIHT